MPRSGFEPSFEITPLSHGIQARRRLTRECWDILAAKPERNPQSDHAQHGRPEIRVSEPGQPKSRIESGCDRQYHRQSDRKAEVLGRLNPRLLQRLLFILRAS